MEIDSLKGILQQRVATPVDFYEGRSGSFQLIFPVFHEDGDMVDIYLQDSPIGGGRIRICDFGMTLMRLSYSFEVNTDTKRRIYESILTNNGIGNDNGNLYLDASAEVLYESILQFSGCVQKICNMRYWQRETIRNAFYDDLEKWIGENMSQFEPEADLFPLSDYPNSVDWSMKYNNRQFYVFGVLGNDKAKNVAISLLEFKAAQLPFMSLVVHENMENLGRREQLYLTRNADTQYPVLNDFCEKGSEDIIRFAGVPA